MLSTIQLSWNSRGEELDNQEEGKFSYNLKQVIGEQENELRDSLNSALHSFVNDEELPNTLQKTIEQFGKERLKKHTKEEVLSKFKIFGLTKAFKKFQTNEELTGCEEKAVINFANTFTSVSLNPATVGKKVVEIVKKK